MGINARRIERIVDQTILFQGNKPVREEAVYCKVNPYVLQAFAKIRLQNKTIKRISSKIKWYNMEILYIVYLILSRKN